MIPRLVLRGSLTHFTHACGFFAFALDARLLVVRATARLREDAILLNLAVKALQRRLEIIMIGNANLRHILPSPRGPIQGLEGESALHAPYIGMGDEGTSP
jgi:hypothetical protein